MKKQLEDYLWDKIPGHYKPHPTPREIICYMVETKKIASEKQAWNTLRKWTKQRIYDYGVSLDLGWKIYENEHPI